MIIIEPVFDPVHRDVVAEHRVDDLGQLVRVVDCRVQRELLKDTRMKNHADRNIAWKCSEGLPAPWAPWPAHCIARNISPSSLLIPPPPPRRSAGKSWLIVVFYDKSLSFTQIDKFQPLTMAFPSELAIVLSFLLLL